MAKKARTLQIAKAARKKEEALVDQFARSGTKLEQLVDALWNEFGGADKLAELIFKAYLQAKEGSMTQVRIVDSLMKMIITHDTKHGKTVEEDLDDLTESQLEAILYDVAESADPGPAEDEGAGAEAGGSVYPHPAKAEAEKGAAGEGEAPEEGGGDSPGEEADGGPEAI